MAQPILMPRPGQMTEECTLLAWHKDEGDPVHRGDVLFEIETDKAVMEVEAFAEGVLLKRLVEAGETVPVNSVCAYIGQPGEEIPAAPSGEAIPAAPASEVPRTHEASPAVVPASATDASREGDGTSRPGAVRSSPRARRLARGAGLEIGSVSGSGPAGRIVERDVRAALAGSAPGPGASSVPAPPPPEQATTAVLQPDGEEPPRPLARMRRIIAERMTLSAGTIPQFTVTVAADVSRLVALRERQKEEGRPLTITDFLVLAAAQSLVEMPLVNSLTDGEQLWLRRRVHIGLAVAVPDGLVVAVLHDADHLTLDEIRERSGDLAQRARAGRLGPDEMSGSTFTISNLGMHGVEHFTAIINPGESAILAVGSAIRTPVAVSEGIAIRSLMRLTLTADHRLIDGELAARFLDDLRGRLEDPEPLATRRLEL